MKDWQPVQEPDRWNPREIWGPTADGLGLAGLFDMVNEIYGQDFLRYR